MGDFHKDVIILAPRKSPSVNYYVQGLPHKQLKIYQKKVMVKLSVDTYLPKQD